MNDAWARRIAAVAALCVAAWASAQEVPQKLAQTRLTAGIHVINAELATTPQQREIGKGVVRVVAGTEGANEAPLRHVAKMIVAEESIALENVALRDR